MQMKYIKEFIIIVAIMLLAGCSDFFEKQSTELETRKTLDELGRLKPNRNIKNPLPELYRQPPQRISVNGKVKLFYFTKNHTVEKLTNLVKSQMGAKVDQSPAINQLIIECKDDSQADEILEFLKKVDVPPIQVNIDCIVLERFADITMDWETKIRVENILGEGVWASGKTTGSTEHLAFPGAALRESKRSEFGLDLGILRGKEGHQVKAVIDMLVSRGYLKVLMNPTLETINGQTAKVESMEETKQEKFVTDTEGNYSTTDYVPVTDVLKVTPNVFADGSIGLQTSIKLGSASKPEGVAQISVRTERSVEMQDNRISPGESLVIGGIRKSEKRSVIRGVPFFKDLPIIGMFFSSKDFEEKATEVIFILTPTISSGGMEYEEMAEWITEKHSIPEHSRGLEETLTDPFGLTRYSEQARKKAAEAEFERFKSELEKIEAEQDVSEAKKAMLTKAEEIMKEKQKALQAARQAEQAKKEAQQLKAEAEKIKKSYEQSKKQIQQKEKLTKDQAAKIKEIEKALQAAQKKAQTAEKKYSESEQEQTQAKQQLKNLKKQSQQLRGELEKLKAESEKKPADKPQSESEQQKKTEPENKTEEKSDPNSKPENKTDS
jgi:hypothetical protein